MKKEYSVFIELEPQELVDLLQPVLKRKGLLKDIPNHATCTPFEDVTTSIEYHWGEELD